jgi:dienelactone hydrolase
MPSVSCCSGFIDSGEPSGKVKSIAEISYYEAIPSGSLGSNSNSSKTHALILCTDVFGWSLPNARLLADGFAETLGIPCFVPDLLDGTDLPSHLMENIQCLTTNPKGLGIFSKIHAISSLFWYFPAFVLSNSMAKNMGRLVKFMKAMDFQGYILQGYCWGGRLAIKAAQGTSGPAAEQLPILAICSNHPGKKEIPAI